MIIDWSSLARKALLVTLACLALVALTSCGGGGDDSGSGVVITPPSTTPPPTQRYYGSLSYAYRGANSCSPVFGIATNHTSQSTATSSAVSGCRSLGGQNCSSFNTSFGNAYGNSDQCAALAFGRSGTRCRLYTGRGSSESAAISAAVSECSASGFSCSFFVGLNRVRAAICSPGTPSTGTPTQTPPQTRSYGAIAFSFNGNCNYTASIVGPYTNESTAESNAINKCREGNGTNCTVVGHFGSGYSGNSECGAIAYGESGNQCRARAGRGSTESAARADALTRCRTGGYSCSIIPSDTRGQLARCAE